MFFRGSRPSRTSTRSLPVLVASLAFFAFFVVSCAGTGNAPNETTQSPGDGSSQTVEVIGISSGDLGRSQASPRVVVSDSLEVPEEERTSLEVSDEDVIYLSVYRGERRTGGYSVEVSSARMEDGGVIVTLRLGEPPQGAIVTQAITYPYAVAALEGIEADEEFSFEDQDGNRLDWPVERRTSG